MTQDEIIELAKHAGYKHPDAVGQCENFAYFNLEAFAKLVADKEREACAKICGEYNFGQAPKMIQDAIRERGES